MSTPKKRQLLLVRWVDSCKSHGWVDDADATIDHPSSNCASVGWLVTENDAYILLASSTGNGQVCLQMQIPKVAITSRKKLKMPS